MSTSSWTCRVVKLFTRERKTCFATPSRLYHRNRIPARILHSNPPLNNEPFHASYDDNGNGKTEQSEPQHPGMIIVSKSNLSRKDSSPPNNVARTFSINFSSQCSNSTNPLTRVKLFTWNESLAGKWQPNFLKASFSSAAHVESGKEGEICSTNTSRSSGSDEGEEEEEKGMMKKMEKEFIWATGPALPTASFNFAPYANESETIKRFVHLGVDLSKLEELKGIPEMILRLDYEKDITPYLKVLRRSGVPSEELGQWLTKNPWVFNTDLTDLKTRIEYLEYKEFSREEIARIVSSHPLWVNFSVEDIHSRLAYFQGYFGLSGDETRRLATRGAKLVTGKRSELRIATFAIKEEMGFTPKETVHLLLTAPKLFRINPLALKARFEYLHRDVGFSHEMLAQNPQLLLTRDTKLKKRIGFLRTVGRDQFNPELPNFVSVRDLLADEGDFTIRVAKSTPSHFNQYLKSL